MQRNDSGNIIRCKIFVHSVPNPMYAINVRLMEGTWTDNDSNDS